MKIRVGSRVKFNNKVFKVVAIREKYGVYIIEYPEGWLGDEPGLDPSKCYFFVDFNDRRFEIVHYVPEIEV